MKVDIRALSAAFALLIGVPALTEAQAPVTTFDGLGTRLKVGDWIWVTDAGNRETEGRIQSLDSTGLMLWAGGSRAIAAADVRVIRYRPHDSLVDGALIGFGAGLGAGAIACHEETGFMNWCTPAVVVVFGAIGTGAGIVIDALIPGRKKVVYQAPGGLPGARVSLAPIIGRTRKGVAASFAF